MLLVSTAALLLVGRALGRSLVLFTGGGMMESMLLHSHSNRSIALILLLLGVRSYFCVVSKHAHYVQSK